MTVDAPHAREVPELAGCIDAIAAHHARRLAQVFDIGRAPRTVAEISRRRFGERAGDTRLLRPVFPCRNADMSIG